MVDTDRDPSGQNARRRDADIQERRTKALEQIATALGQIHHELIQLRVQATNANVTLARKR